MRRIRLPILMFAVWGIASHCLTGKLTRSIEAPIERRQVNCNYERMRMCASSPICTSPENQSDDQCSSQGRWMRGFYIFALMTLPLDIVTYPAQVIGRCSVGCLVIPVPYESPGGRRTDCCACTWEK